MVIGMEGSECPETLAENFWDWFLQPRPGLFLVLFIIGTICEVVVHFILNISDAYTHFFYVIIILAGLWYPAKAFWFAVFFGMVYAFVAWFHTGMVSNEILFRVFILCMVAVAIGNIVLRMHAQTRRLERSQKALAQANRNLSLLSGITRHDINNQLMGLSGFISLSKEKTTDPDCRVGQGAHFQ